MSNDLSQTFKHATDLFNRGSYDELGALLHIDAILKRVDDPGSVVGIGNIIAYLNTQQKSQMPQIRDFEDVAYMGQDGTHGIVTGRAKYKDKQNDYGAIPIQFAFIFTRDGTGEDWRMINAFAVPMR